MRFIVPGLLIHNSLCTQRLKLPAKLDRKNSSWNEELTRVGAKKWLDIEQGWAGWGAITALMFKAGAGMVI